MCMKLIVFLHLATSCIVNTFCYNATSLAYTRAAVLLSVSMLGLESSMWHCALVCIFLFASSIYFSKEIDSLSGVLTCVSFCFSGSCSCLCVCFVCVLCLLGFGFLCFVLCGRVLVCVCVCEFLLFGVSCASHHMISLSHSLVQK